MGDAAGQTDQPHEDSPTKLLREVTPSERALVNKCIDAIESRAAYLEGHGLNTRNFMFGVSNSLFVAWSLGGLRPHFWIVYLIETAMLFPIRWKHQINAVPLKQHLYWLDFCWITNFSFIASLLTLWACPSVSEQARIFMSSTAWGCANGPLLMAVGVLGNALVFHDMDNTASVLIHLFPSMVMYMIGWNHEEVSAAWPGVFRVPFLKGVHPWKDIYRNAASWYLTWWVIYTTWLLSTGIRVPASGYDTIFHANCRGGSGKKIAQMIGRSSSEQKRRAQENDFTRVDAIVYMVLHLVGSCGAIGVSLLCYLDQRIHLALIGLMAFLTIKNAARRYMFYMLKSYGEVLRKELGIPLNRKASALQWAD